MHLADVTLFHGPKTGGVRTYLAAKRNWIKKLSARVRHSLIVPASSPAEAADTELVGVPSCPLPFTNGYRLPIGSCERALRRLQPDVIEVGDPYYFAWQALRVGKDLRVPVIGFYHSDLPRLVGARFGPGAQRLAFDYVSRLYAQFDLVLAPSKALVLQLRDLGVSQAHWQPLGVDTDVFSPHRRDRSLRSRLGLKETQRLLVYAGRFAREKNLPLLIEAVQRLGTAYHLLVIGSGPCRLPSREYLTCFPFENDRTQLARWIASSDAFVHAGDQETFGLAVVEAMACGIPVVGMAAGGVVELIDPTTGVLVRPGSAKEMAEGIAALFERDLVELGNNARLKVERQYTWEQVVRRLLGYYTQLCRVPAIDRGMVPETAGVAD